MKIYVCVKHVPDSAATITIREKNQIDESVTFLLNPYDEHAVEEAARLRAQMQDSEVVAVTLGKEGALGTLQSALAMGADRGILIKTDDRPDSILTARALKAAIEQDGKPDIIFTGKESIDSEGMQTMFRLAAALDVPIATSVVAFAIDENKALVECELEAGVKQLLEMPLPCVIAAGKGLNKPKYPTFMDIRKAKKKEIKQIDLTSLPIEKPTASMQILELKPAIEQRQPKELKGPPKESVRQLIQVLREEAKVI
ncbi:MAG: electron transfer flavoprotein subunit beta/FixA family protein [Desulfobacterales bacterium]|jgi:electron transfer flavoprotein beta subunit|nr:electron transfer flavoprotein subunit beta/FixA family protein [Deltaproteobacteria bacterium]